MCFVGVSFYRETLQDNPMLRTSMAQAFTAARDGYVCYDALSAPGTPAVLPANIRPLCSTFFVFVLSSHTTVMIVLLRLLRQVLDQAIRENAVVVPDAVRPQTWPTVA